MSEKMVTAAVLVIGNEILSGRTLDKNTQYIGQKLGEKGIQLREARVVPDVKEKVVEAVNALRAAYDYVFTTGGIGPTHDDITVECIAEAFGVGFGVDEEAYRILLDHYGEAEFTEARQKMAIGPIGARLIPNPVSAAPGFVIGNVHVMAGVPRIMQAMLGHVLVDLVGGEVVHSLTLTFERRESEMADVLAAVQAKYPDVDIGSYPQYKDGVFGVSVVLRGVDEARLQEVAAVIDP